MNSLDDVFDRARRSIVRDDEGRPAGIGAPMLRTDEDPFGGIPIVADEPAAAQPRTAFGIRPTRGHTAGSLEDFAREIFAPQPVDLPPQAFRARPNRGGHIGPRAINTYR